MSAPPARDVSSSQRLARAVDGLRLELPSLLRVAIPVILAELGWMAMGLVDTIMVGPLGPEAIGAVGVGSGVFTGIAVFGMGLLLGLDTLVSHWYGAGDERDCRRWLLHGLVLGLLIAAPMMGVLAVVIAELGDVGLHPSVETLVLPFFRVIAWSLLPLLGYAAGRRYLQGVSAVGPVAFALVSANIVNIVANWILIDGHLGAPRLGVVGSAWATVIARTFMFAVIALAVVRRDWTRGLQPWREAGGIQRWRLARLLRLGLPAAAQVTLEVGVFAAATVLAGRLAPVQLAAHQIALNIAAFVFMVPLGASSAGAVLVGQALGRRDPRGAARAGWTTIATIAVFMLAIASLFVVVPTWLLAVFSRDPLVLALGSRLLLVAALFQLFDGLQAVATGVLRGLGDTKTAMVANLVGHWGFGLPVGYWLCFVVGWGVVGLWVGLSIGLTSVGVVLLVVWALRIRAVLAGVASAPARIFRPHV